MARLDIEKQNKIEPQRVDYAKKEVEKLGFQIIFECKNRIEFEYLGEKIQFYPYSGWATGKSITDGRGLKNLLNQIK